MPPHKRNALTDLIREFCSRGKSFMKTCSSSARKFNETNYAATKTKRSAGFAKSFQYQAKENICVEEKIHERRCLFAIK